MAIRYLLDTNICIYIAKRHPIEVRERFESLALNEVSMSVVTFGEMRFGAEKSQKRDVSLKILENLASQIQILPLPKLAGMRYGIIRHQLQKIGQPIGNNDLWIAAHAITADLVLVTNNTREFQRVDGLRFENWTG